MASPTSGMFSDFRPVTRQRAPWASPPKYTQQTTTFYQRQQDDQRRLGAPTQNAAAPATPAAPTAPAAPAAPPALAGNVASPPVAAPAPVVAYAELPTQYLTGLSGFVNGDPAAYYTDRGAEQSAQRDYYNLLNLWQDSTGAPLTADDWGRVWGGLNAYRTRYGTPSQAYTVSDAYNYLRRMLASSPRPDYVSYLRTGEI